MYVRTQIRHSHQLKYKAQFAMQYLPCSTLSANEGHCFRITDWTIFVIRNRRLITWNRKELRGSALFWQQAYTSPRLTTAKCVRSCSFHERAKDNEPMHPFLFSQPQNWKWSIVWFFSLTCTCHSDNISQWYLRSDRRILGDCLVIIAFGMVCFRCGRSSFDFSIPCRFVHIPLEVEWYIRFRI